MPYYKVTVTIVADDEKYAEAAVERGLDKQGFAILEIAAEETNWQDDEEE